MSNGFEFDFKELINFDKELVKLANNKMPTECKKFMRAEGTKFKRKTLSVAKSRVKKKTGNYFKSIKRGKVYKYRGNGAWAIRVYSGAPHAHLIEKGHRSIVNGVEKGFVRGKNVFKDAENQFSSTYFNDVQSFVDKIVKL